MTLDEQIEEDFKKYGTLSESYLQRKYRMTKIEARKYLREYGILITTKIDKYK